MWTEERIETLKRLIAEGKTNKEIGEHFGLTGHDSIRRVKRKLRDKGLLELETALRDHPKAVNALSKAFERIETSGTLQFILDKTRISTLEELLEYCEVDKSVWEVDRFIVNKWEVGAKNVAGDIEVEPLFQVKAYLKKRQQVSVLKDILEDLKSDAKNYAPQYSALSQHSLPSDRKYCLEFSIFDLHVGKLIWEQECGQDYDSDIAEAVFYKAVEDLLQKSAPYHDRLNRILFVVGNDLLNADNYEMTTTKGTPQHCDSRHQKMFKRARVMMQKAVDRLSGFAPVDVMIIPGNHDQQSIFYLGDVLEVAFENNPNVRIDNSPPLRKYWKYGNNLIMFTHGSNERHTELPLIMATEQPVLWGQTKYREVHLGHLHKKSGFSTPEINEYHGVRVRVLPSLCPSDDWFTEKGYVGNIRSAECYVWHETNGLEGHFSYNA